MPFTKNSQSAYLILLLLSGCTTIGLSNKPYEQTGEQNVQFTFTESHGFLKTNSAAVRIAEMLADCKVRILGKIDISAGAITKFALLPDKSYGINIMNVSKSYLGGPTGISGNDLYLTPKKTAHYEISYTLEEDGEGIEFFEVAKGKRTRLKTKAPDRCEKRELVD